MQGPKQKDGRTGERDRGNEKERMGQRGREESEQKGRKVMIEEDETKTDLWLRLLGGAIIGAGCALVFKPQSIREIAEYIWEKGLLVSQPRLAEMIRQISDKVVNVAETISDRATSIADGLSTRERYH